MGGIYRALLVGNAVFEADPHELPLLKGPPNDLRLLEDTLTHEMFGLYRAEHVRVLLDHAKNEIEVAMEEFFSKADPADQLLFYYSGHGRLDIQNNLYLCARNTQVAKLLSTAIPTTIIRYAIDQSPSQRRIIILDCCNSGRFKGGELPESLKGSGMFVLTSTRAGQLAADAETDGPSAFTKFLVSALRDPATDRNGDDYVSINEAYDYLVPRLHAETKQSPQRFFDHTIREVPLGRAAAQEGRGGPRTSGGNRPALEVSRTLIEHRIKVGDKIPEEIVDVWNSGTGTLDWTAESNADWISVEPQKSYFKIRYDPHPGSNRAMIVVRDRDWGGSKTVRVRVEAEQAERSPILKLSATQVDFGKVSRSAEIPAETVRVTNDGSGSLNLEVEACPTWIRARIRGELLELAPDTSTAGRFKGEVVLRTTAGKGRITVRMMVEQGPVLAVSPTRVDFGKVALGDRGGVFAKVYVQNAGKGQLKWDFEPHGEFFRAVRYDDGVSLAIDANASIGTHQGTLIIKSHGGERTVSVHAQVLAKPTTSVPQNVEFGPGRWSLEFSAWGLQGRMDLDLMANGEFHGTYAIHGLTDSVSGAWSYQPAPRILQLVTGVRLFGMAIPTGGVQIHITGQSGSALVGQDQTMGQYVLSRSR